MNDDILIINGKTYRHTPEVNDGPTYIFLYKKRGLPHVYETTCPQYQTVDELITVFRNEVKLKKGEIIVSEDDVISAWRKSGYIQVDVELFLKCLGFKKDGV